MSVSSKELLKANRFFPHDVILVRCVIATCPSVRLAVRLSVTNQSSATTAKRRITQTSPPNSPGTLIF